MDSRGPEGEGRAPLRQRVACEVLVAGRVDKGIATELAPHEIHLQVPGADTAAPGGDVSVRLDGDLGGGAPIELRGFAAAPLPMSGSNASGPPADLLVVRIVEAPPEYHALFEPARRPGVELLIEIEDDSAPGPSSRSVSRVVDDDEDWPTARSTEADLPARRVADRDAPVPRSPSPSAHVIGRTPLPGRPMAGREPARPASPPAAGPPARGVDGPARVDPAHVVADGPFEGETRRPHPTRAANAIVIYEGDKLRDVYEVLERLGARPERARLRGPTRFRGWDLPPKLVVVDAQDAMTIDWPRALGEDGVVRIAVASSASAVVGKALRSQGFHYLVRRPVHGKALEVLLRHALHRGHDRRQERRSPVGIDARLLTGRWRWSAACTVLELSPTGCRIVTREDVPLLTPVRLRISRAASRRRSITLRARVVRRRLDEASGEWALALRFVEVPPEQRGRLDDLLARAAVGPTTILADGPATRVRRSWRRWLRRSTATPGVGIGAAADSSAVPVAAGHDVAVPHAERDRRLATRAVLDGEVLALDEDRRRVDAVLAGRDLSTLGMRVDPHPELSVGRRLVVAFYDQVSRGRIEVAAEVIRDDGERGLGIRFVEMDPDSAARLEQLVATLPTVESLLPDSRPLMVARIRPEPFDGVPRADPSPSRLAHPRPADDEVEEVPESAVGPAAAPPPEDVGAGSQRRSRRRTRRRRGR